jgi:hypothetical protein
MASESGSPLSTGFRIRFSGWGMGTQKKRRRRNLPTDFDGVSINSGNGT